MDNSAVKPPKVVYIGAGSAVFGLKALSSILRSERLRGVELQLVDINAPNLEVMTGLAEVMNREWGARARINATTDRRAALPDADFVIVSVQVGPRETVWEQDWRIPLRHGVRQPYAENSGPGAFAHTARNLPLLIDIARDMEALCPDAWYLNFVNPMIRLTWAVQRYTSVKVVGLCHQLLWGYALAMALVAERYGVEVPPGFNLHTNYHNKPFLGPVMEAGYKYLDIKACGINHFSWAYDIRDRATGEDLYPAIRRRWLNGYRRDFEPLSREMFEIFGLMPTPGDSHLCEFLPWTHDPLSKPWEKYNLELQSFDGNRKRRADRLQQARDIVAGKRSVEELRGLRSEGIPEIVEGITYNLNTYMHQLNLPNNGLIPNLPADAIVETPGVVSGLGIRGLNMEPLPEGIAELCRRELAYSSLVVDAAYHGDEELALQALLLDPMMNDIDRARAILADFLTTFAEYLPQFHGEWR
jgi:alpha-galactosidase